MTKFILLHQTLPDRVADDFGVVFQMHFTENTGAVGADSFDAEV
jgi:hypothetical protein